MNESPLLSCLLQKKLILIGRAIPVEAMKYALESCIRAGFCFFESPYLHTLENPIADNCEKLLALKACFGNALHFGAGTVLTACEVVAAKQAGAEFIVSPNTNAEVISKTKALGLLSIPGAMTPTEIISAHSYGGDIIKLFPAFDLGYSYIKSIRVPLCHIPMLAAGGVTPQTIPEFQKLGIQAFGVASSVLRKDLIDNENYEEIYHLARQHKEALLAATV